MKIDSLLAGVSADLVGLVPDRRDTDTVRSAYEDGISDGWNECRSELIRRIASLTHPPVADSSQDARDAARWRYLITPDRPVDTPHFCVDVGGEWGTTYGDFARELIDAAMKQGDYCGTED